MSKCNNTNDPEKCKASIANKIAKAKAEAASIGTWFTKDINKGDFNMAKKYWRCTICGDLHFGESAPTTCPTCGQGKDKSVLITKEEFLKVLK